MTQKSRLIRLRSNGNIMNTDDLVAIIRKDINLYGVILRNAQVVLAADGSDVDQIIEYMGIPTIGTTDPEGEPAAAVVLAPGK